MSRSRWLGVLAVLVSGSLVGDACDSARDQARGQPESGSVTEAAVAYAAGIPGADSRYVVPTDRELDRIARAWSALEGGRTSDARTVASEWGYEIDRLGDGVMALRGRGGYFVHRRDGADVIVEVPHPIADARTEMLGGLLFERVGARVLLVAGAHRDAGESGRADVAHAPDSVFDAVHRVATRGGDVVVQVHGYADHSAPDTDVIVSRGAEPTELTDAVSRMLSGFAVCLWRPSTTGPCGDLAGTENLQGRSARAAGAEFVHLEVSREVRDDDERLRALVRAVADALS